MTGITQQQAEELNTTNRRLLAEITDLKIEVAKLKRKLDITKAFGKDDRKNETGIYRNTISGDCCSGILGRPENPD